MKLLKLYMIFGLQLLISISSIAQIDSLIQYVQDDEYIISIETQKEYFRYWRNRSVSDSMKLEIYHKTPHYFYSLLDSIATDEKLFELTTHKSPIVQAYAAEAIAHRDTLLLPLVIKNMMDNYSEVAVKKIDIVISWPTAERIFSGLEDRRRLTGLPTQSFIDKLDSIYISHRNLPSFYIGIELCKLKSKSLNPVIEKVAIERKDIYAINYLYKWFKGDYYDLLNNLYLDILDSCTTAYNTPNIKDVIKKLIGLNDKETLKKLGEWLNNNRKKWVGIKGIDKILDNSYIIGNSLRVNNSRYPYDSVDVGFLIGDWFIISELEYNILSPYYESDTIVLKRSISKKEIRKHQYQKIRFNYKYHVLSSDYYQNVSDNRPKFAGLTVFDASNTRLCFNSSDWKWYSIIIKEDELILIKE